MWEGEKKQPPLSALELQNHLSKTPPRHAHKNGAIFRSCEHFTEILHISWMVLVILVLWEATEDVVFMKKTQDLANHQIWWVAGLCGSTNSLITWLLLITEALNDYSPLLNREKRKYLAWRHTHAQINNRKNTLTDTTFALLGLIFFSYFYVGSDTTIIYPNNG